MQREKIEEIIKLALDNLYEYDNYLIVNRPPGSIKDCHVSERGIVFRFGLYFYQLLHEIEDKYFDELSLDVEYNRNYYEKKMLPSFAQGTFPDMILHKRGDNNNNVLVLEFKTWWNSNNSSDIDKIRQFLDTNGIYKYKLGASITLDKDHVIITWIDVLGNDETFIYLPQNGN